MARGHYAFSCGYSGYGHGGTPPCWPCGHTWQPDWCVSVRKVWVVLIPLPWRGARRAGWSLGEGQSSVPEGVREFPLPPRQAAPATSPEEGNSTCHPSGGGEFWAGYSPSLEGSRRRRGKPFCGGRRIRVWSCQRPPSGGTVHCGSGWRGVDLIFALIRLPFLFSLCAL